MKTLTDRKDGFTMLELIFAIIVIGVLAALAIPRLDRDMRQEAKDNILSAIRYTQHMALMDNKRDPFDPAWEDKYWKIIFTDDGSNYSISTGVGATIRYATDPSSGKLINGDAATGSKSSIIGKKFSVDSVARGGGCGSPEIGFDNFGRPFDWTPAASVGGATPYDKYMSSDCTLKFTFAKSGVTDLNITIAKETGMVTGD